MAYVITKQRNGQNYHYLVEKYRDAEGRQKVRHLQYLGKDPRPYLREVVKT
jgi:hypothetical protein